MFTVSFPLNFIIIFVIFDDWFYQFTYGKRGRLHNFILRISNYLQQLFFFEYVW